MAPQTSGQPSSLFAADLCDPAPLFELLRQELAPASILIRVTSPAGIEMRTGWPSGTVEPGEGVVEVSPAVDGGLTRILLSVTPPAGGFPAAASARWESLRPFVALLLGKLCELGRERVEKRILSEACDRSAAAVLVFDGQDQIVFANRSADELLSRQTEELLAVSLTDDRPVRLIQFVLDELAGEGGGGRRRAAAAAGGPRTVLLNDGTRFDLSIAPLPGHADHRLVVLREMRRFEMSRARPGLREAGLSEREIEVVDLLLLGLRNAEIAERLRLSSYTVKDHLKHVFHKLNIRSRAELVSRVLQLSG